MWVLGTRPRSSARAASTLNYWDLSRDPVCFWFTGWKPLHLPEVSPVHFAPSICFVTLISLWSCISSLSPSAIVACLLWIPLQYTILTHADRTYSHSCPPLSKDHAASRMSFFIRCNLGEITSWPKGAARARLTQNTTLEYSQLLLTLNRYHLTHSGFSHSSALNCLPSPSSIHESSSNSNSFMSMGLSLPWFPMPFSKSARHICYNMCYITDWLTARQRTCLILTRMLLF